MSQFTARIEKQKEVLAAEEWGKGVKWLHVHSMNSCWYDNRPEDTADGNSVMDIMYNSGKIVRRINKTGKEIIMDRGTTGKEPLLEKFRRSWPRPWGND